MENLSEDQKKYYEYHGCKIVRKKRNLYSINIPVKCQMLTEDYKCKLHGTPEKPSICRNGPKKEGPYLITEGCLLEDE